MPKLSNEIYEKVISDYLSGLTQKEVGEINGLCRDAVGKILKRFGVETREHTGDRQYSRKWEWDYDFFYGRTKEVAYWAGFLLADGNIDKDTGSTLSFVIQKKDLFYVESFCDAISVSKDSIFKQGNAFGVHLHKNCLIDSLYAWGITPQKSKNFVAPSCVSEYLMPHFLRGWIDGDGSVYRYGVSARIVVASGNKESLMWFADGLRSIGYDGNIGIRETYDKKYPGNYTLYIGGRNQVERVCECLLVDTEFCIERKWNSFYENKGKQFVHVCEMCEKEFLVSKYRHEQEPQNGRFCSKECFDDYQRL